MFASRSILQHVLRGAIGFGLFAVAFIHLPTKPLLASLALPLALVALRGCPMCWTVGLLETLAARAPFVSRKAPCQDGRCASRGDSAGALEGLEALADPSPRRRRAEAGAPRA